MIIFCLRISFLENDTDIFKPVECKFLDSSVEYRYGDVGFILPLEYVNKYKVLYKNVKNYKKSKSVTIEEFIEGKGECIIKRK